MQMQCGYTWDLLQQLLAHPSLILAHNRFICTVRPLSPPAPPAPPLPPPPPPPPPPPLLLLLLLLLPCLLCSIEFVTSGGKLLKRFDMSECGQAATAAGGVNETRGVSRPRLLNALADQLPPGTIKFNSNVTGAALHDAGEQLVGPSYLLRR
jgi:hypothetical protein